MKFLIALISAATVASAIQLNSPLFNVKPIANPRRLPQQNLVNNELTTMNFAQTVMSKTFSDKDYDWKRASAEHFYAGKPMFYSQQNYTQPSDCSVVLSMLQ
jgi:hypothetical protein